MPPSTGQKAFGKRLLQARLDLSAKLGRQVTQTEIGKALGVTGVTVGRWESGEKEPSLETVQRLAKLLRTDPAFLAFGAGAQEVVDPELDRKLTPEEEERAIRTADAEAAERKSPAKRRRRA